MLGSRRERTKMRLNSRVLNSCLVMFRTVSAGGYAMVRGSGRSGVDDM